MVTSRGHQTEKGQVLVLFTLIFVFVVLPLMAWVIDQGFLYHSRRNLQKVVDSACLAGAIAIQNSADKADRTANAQAAIIASLTENGIESAAYTPKDGTGAGLIKGIEINGKDIRVRVKQPTTTLLSHFLGNTDGWEMAAGAHCQSGLGGVLPLALKEYEKGGTSDLISTSKNNDKWEEPCDQKYTPYNQGADELLPKSRDPENCWVWGDWQVLAGDGVGVNEGPNNKMKGLITPDLRCENPPSDSNMCPSPLSIPPVPEGTNSSTIKYLMDQYITAGGYDGPLPIPGNYSGVNSALIIQGSGVSGKFNPKPVIERYDIGDQVIVFVYKSGKLWDADVTNQYVEVIGYAIVEFKYMDANTVAVAPVYPPPDAAWDEDGNPIKARDFLPKSLEEIVDEGFIVYPILIEWD